MMKTIPGFLLGGIMCAVLLVSSATLAASETEFVEGSDFQPLSNAEPDAPDIELFYWYGDPSSFQVDMMLDEYLKLHPELSIKRTPLVARLSWRPQAYIDSILEQLQPFADELPTKAQIYQACLSDCNQFKDYAAIKQWIGQWSDEVSLDVIEPREVWQAEKDARQRAKKFAIWQVPTIIVKGRFMTNGEMINSPLRLTRLLDWILRPASAAKSGENLNN